jgi:hypothetical protein
LAHNFETQECRNKNESVEKYNSSFHTPCHTNKKMFILPGCAPSTVIDNFNGVMMMMLMMTATFVFP